MPAVSAVSTSHSSRRRPMPRRRCVGRTAISTRCARSSPNSIMANPTSEPRSKAASSDTLLRSSARWMRAASYFHARPYSMCSRDISAMAWLSRASAGRKVIAAWLMRRIYTTAGGVQQAPDFVDNHGLSRCARETMRKPNFLVILIDDLRCDEFGAGGHPYLKTPHIDRLAREGALFERAFHTPPICSPNRASVLTGQFASRHGIIDNVARDAMSHRLPNYHLALQALGYETAHIGKWHMGNDGSPRPGYGHWVSFDGHGRLNDPKLNVNGRYEQRSGYMTDLLNRKALDFVAGKRKRPWALFFAHKAVHPDAEQAADGTLTLDKDGGYKPAERHG